MGARLHAAAEEGVTLYDVAAVIGAVPVSRSHLSRPSSTPVTARISHGHGLHRASRPREIRAGEGGWCVIPRAQQVSASQQQESGGDLYQ